MTFDVEKALHGPFCEGSCGKRTRNPSRKCCECLGKSCCYECRGSGISTSKTGFLSGCGPCSGTGVNSLRNQNA